MIKRLLILGLVLLPACAIVDCVAPERLPDGAVRFDPQGGVVTDAQKAIGMRGVSWRWHYQLMERCTGKHRPYESIRWYFYPNTSSFEVRYHEARVAGWWDGKEGIYLADSARYGLTIRHEMWHYLTGKSSHDGMVEECGYELGQPGAVRRFPDIPAFTD